MRNNVWQLSICILFILSSLPLQAEEREKSTELTITIKGRWQIVRSLSSIPFTSTINGAQLNIECTSPDYDISITLTNSNDEAVWQRDISAPETSFVSIPLDNLPHGSYTIKISNDYGGYLWGTFQL